jgi:hypothetical protein
MRDWPLLVVLLLLARPLAAECPGSARLEEALTLVALAHPVLLAEGAADREAERAPNWKASLSLGYSITDTFESGEAGPNAALRVTIPLFDRTSRQRAAERHAAAVARQDATTAAFLADVQTLCELAGQVKALDTLRAFTRDRLRYRQERVDQGLDPADTLWREAEAMQKGEHDWSAASARLGAVRLTLARRHGGAEWERLLTLLSAMTP